MSSKKTITIFPFIFLQIITLCTPLPLSTNSKYIVEQTTGKRVKLTCVNWVSHLPPMIAEGLEKKPLNYITNKILETGFNCVRFTWPTFMFTRPDYGNLKVSESLDKFGLAAAKMGIAKNNPEFLNMKVVDVHKAVVDGLGRSKLMVVLDNHVSRPDWCCAENDGNGFFGDVDFDPEEWLKGLATVARTYKGNYAVVAVSLRNELRGPRQKIDDWYKYMQQGANTIHNENPDFLVIISGLVFESNLNFLKTKPFVINRKNKLVYAAHWYAFGIPAEKWVAQINQICGNVTKSAKENYLFLTEGNNSFPVFMSEFGVSQTGLNEADNRYISCFLASVAEYDIDWALWTFQGSYILRQGKVNLFENYGVIDFKWERLRDPLFIERLRLIRRTNQALMLSNRTYYILFHPQSGQCAQIRKTNIFLTNCTAASKWGQHQDNGPIKLDDGSPQCLRVAGDGLAACVSNDCSNKWKFVSSSGLHLAALDGKGKYLCLERNASDYIVVTKKCLCVGDNLVDFPTCPDNPEVQWFKFVPANV